MSKSNRRNGAATHVIVTKAVDAERRRGHAAIEAGSPAPAKAPAKKAPRKRRR